MRCNMKKVQLVSVFLFVVFGVLVFLQAGCSNTKKDKVLSGEELIQRGKFLVATGDCNVCHSPKIMTAMGPVPDTTRLLSGHPSGDQLGEIDPAMYSSGRWAFVDMSNTAWVGPWGVSYTANLTPDPETGLGNWTPDLFIKAIRSGKHMGVGRPILPPMPWPALNNYGDEDLKAIFAYLHSLPAIHNQVPDPVPPNMVATLFTKEKTKEKTAKANKMQ
jgi:hypothetical protein